MLDRIRAPKDVRSLDMAQLQQLAQELRMETVEVISQVGGHLAPSLGVVELTLALFSVLDLDRDKIVWDVGHQSYVHKLLTGRRAQFPTIRQYGGISGFPRRDESPYDAFGTGHASTSISAALGMAVARDLQGQHYKVVAVIGDGALTGGMAYEGLNNCGQLQKDLLVVLNDNAMSIAPNVGAVSRYLTRLRLAPGALRAKRDVKQALRRIPGMGNSVLRAIERVKDSVKYLLVPGMLFEELGFTYYGPIDGHDLPLLVETLKEVYTLHQPVLLHVVTKKGRGYPPAERNPEYFHGTSPFVLATGEPKENGHTVTYTEVFGKTLVQLAEKDPRIVAITAAMPDGTGLAPFARQFPERFFDVGIAEQHALTFAAGLATQGMRPVVAIYSTFLQRAYDQLIHDICLQKLPVVLAVDRAGLVGHDGPTHHGAFDLSYLDAVPGITVMSPRDEAQLQRMLVTALSLEGPVAIRYPRGKAVGVPLLQDPQPLPVGQGELLRDGEDVVFVAIGPMVQRALASASELAASGIDAGVIDAVFAKPMDEQLILRAATRTGRVVTVEDNTAMGGFGAQVAALLAQKAPGVACLIAALPDRFVGQGRQEELYQEVGLTPQALTERVRRWLERLGSAGCRQASGSEGKSVGKETRRVGAHSL
ncbi:MAG: 1-deoxy-D-xylulose-5-phosphate synthase [Firmicutes bacterium]|nr:1-deoxy-D-xylulose-5-phosphate synthase [Bacillota bacterium]